MAVALVGVGVGLAGAFALTRFMRSCSSASTRADPATFLTVSLLLTVVALLASFLPARRAARMDPTVSLRQS